MLEASLTGEARNVSSLGLQEGAWGSGPSWCVEVKTLLCLGCQVNSQERLLQNCPKELESGETQV